MIKEWRGYEEEEDELSEQNSNVRDRLRVRLAAPP